MKLLTENEIKILEENNIIKDLTIIEQKQYIYSKAFYDKVFFGDFFLSHWKGTGQTPEFHKEIYELLGGKDNTCIIVPRGHGKTTTILIDIIHSLVYKIYGSQLYVATAGLGAESLGKIKYELETNKIIKEVFGDLVPKTTAEEKKQQGTRRWREKLLELTNGESIETLTKGQPVRGKRPRRIIVDDFEENKDVMNKSVVEKARTWFFTSLYNTLLPGGKIVILGTIVGNMCMVKYIRDKKDWKCIEYKAINNGKPLWPDMWPLEELEKRKKEIGTTLFNQEFMNIPLQAENSVIKEDQIKYYNPDDIGNFDSIYIGVDPAISEKENTDSFAIVITGYIGVNKYVIEAKELRGKNKDPFTATQIVKRLYDKYKANRVIIETTAFQEVMKKLFQAEYIAVEEIKPNKDKITRLLEFQPEFEQGRVYFNKEKTFDLVDQLLQFPDVEYDDLVDAMIYSFKKQNKKVFITSL